MNRIWKRRPRSVVRNQIRTTLTAALASHDYTQDSYVRLWVSIDANKRLIEVHLLYVDPTQQKKRIGTYLVNLLQADAADEGYRIVCYSVLREGLRLWYRRGFRPVRVNKETVWEWQPTYTFAIRRRLLWWWYR